MYTADYWQGIVDGLLRCSHCDHTVIARLLAWRGQQLDQRIYALAQVGPEAVSTFLRNMNNDYCDLSRKLAEWDALVATSPPTLAGAFQVPDMRCKDVKPITQTPSYPDWRNLKPDDPGNQGWWTEFPDLTITENL